MSVNKVNHKQIVANAKAYHEALVKQNPGIAPENLPQKIDPNIAIGSFADKKIEKPGTTPIQYMEAPVRYNYGNTVDEMFVEGPTLISNGGIWESKDQNGKTGWSIMSKLGSDENEMLLKQCFDVIHASCANQMIPHKVKIELGEFPDNMVPNMLSKISNPPKDKVTKQFRAGEAPQIYWKLFKTGYGISEEKTIFTGLDGKPIDWELLKSVILKYIPLFHVKTIYSSGKKKSISITLKSAVVIDAKGKSSAQYQNDTISQYNASNPDDVKILQERMLQLATERKEMAEKGNALQGQQYPDGLAPAGMVSPQTPQLQIPPQQPQVSPQLQQPQQPPIQIPQQLQAQAQFQQPPIQIPQQFQAPPQTTTPQFQQPQQVSPPQTPAQIPQQFQQPQIKVQTPQNTMAQMQAFLQNQPTANALNLPEVPAISGLTVPQFAPITAPTMTIQ